MKILTIRRVSHKQKHRRIYLTFTFSERHMTVTRSLFDNDQRHVTAFRPISEAAHSWSYDNVSRMHYYRPMLQPVRGRMTLYCL